MDVINREVYIGSKKLIKGKALICAPVMGKNREELTRVMEKISKTDIDLVEWRIDALNENFEELYKYVSLSLYPIPLIITYRSEKEGGLGKADKREYAEIIKKAAKIGADAVDIELSSGMADELCAEVKSKGASAIISYHNFEFTESDDEICGILSKMASVKGDVYKMAFMPKSFSDTLRVLELSEKFNRDNFPVLLISMGELGKLSRIACNQSGAPFTFASASGVSAPGQMDAAFVRRIISEIR